jgi:magnesium-transporting ATPase (P-type)
MLFASALQIELLLTSLKNIIWTFALFWYQIFANFDCSYIFDYSYILLYNLAFTSLPVILMGILDQDVDDKVSLAVPQLYRRGIERKEWTQIKFWYVEMTLRSMLELTICAGHI